MLIQKLEDAELLPMTNGAARWEQVAVDTYRMRVPNGWLIKVDNGDIEAANDVLRLSPTVTFYRDLAGDWKLPETEEPLEIAQVARLKDGNLEIRGDRELMAYVAECIQNRDRIQNLFIDVKVGAEGALEELRMIKQFLSDSHDSLSSMETDVMAYSAEVPEEELSKKLDRLAIAIDTMMQAESRISEFEVFLSDLGNPNAVANLDIGTSLSLFQF